MSRDYQAERAAERPPTTATIATTWDDIKELFHELWGNNAGGKYDKDTWKKLQQCLERLERATETLGPAARTGLTDSLRRCDSPSDYAPPVHHDSMTPGRAAYEASFGPPLSGPMPGNGWHVNLTEQHRLGWEAHARAAIAALHQRDRANSPGRAIFLSMGYRNWSDQPAEYRNAYERIAHAAIKAS